MGARGLRETRSRVDCSDCGGVGSNKPGVDRSDDLSSGRLRTVCRSGSGDSNNSMISGEPDRELDSREGWRERLLFTSGSCDGGSSAGLLPCPTNDSGVGTLGITWGVGVGEMGLEWVDVMGRSGDDVVVSGGDDDS